MPDPLVPMGYYVHETPDRVKDVGPMRFRTRWGARRAARRMNAARAAPAYRWQVSKTARGWELWPMQNVLMPIDPYEQARVLVDEAMAVDDRALRDIDEYVQRERRRQRP